MRRCKFLVLAAGLGQGCQMLMNDRWRNKVIEVGSCSFPVVGVGAPALTNGGGVRVTPLGHTGQ